MSDLGHTEIIHGVYKRHIDVLRLENFNLL